jgi:hypothetical protein
MDRPLADHAQAVAAGRLLDSDVADLDDLPARIEQAGRRNEMVVLLVDPWTTRIGGYKTEMALMRSKRISDLLPDARGTAEWEPPTAIYNQMLQIVRNPERNDLPADLPGRLSQEMCVVLAKYRGKESECAEHAIAIFGDVEGQELFDASLIQRLYDDRDFLRLHGERWRPTPVEAVVETSRRERDTNAIQAALVGTRTSLVRGGSVEYGPNFNVHGNRHGKPPSDLDIVIVVKDACQLLAIVESLYNVPGVDDNGVRRLIERTRVFVKRYDDDQTIFSHKLPMWPRTKEDRMMTWAPASQEYSLSLHFLTDAVLHHILVERCPTLRREVAGMTRTVRDYREWPTREQDHQRTFAGRDRYTPSPVKPGSKACYHRPVSTYSTRATTDTALA